jgi:macrolide-specific efflux system membrane fusion protein
MKKLKKFWTWLKAGKARPIGAGVIAALLIFGIVKIATAGSAQKIQYQTSTVQKGAVVSTISASGNVLTTSILSITTQATGVVSKVYVKDGDRVTAGQTLAVVQLDTDGTLANARSYASLVSAQNGVNSANNNYRLSQANLANTYNQLQGHTADETFAQKAQRTQAEVSNDNTYDQTKSAAANLVSAVYSYRLTSPTIIAPFSGTIESVGLVEGMVLSSSNTTTNINSEKVAVIKGDSLPVISASLSEVDVPNVKVGQKATVTFDSITGKTFSGIVATVDRVGTISNNVTSYGVNIKLDSGSDQILPNMAATADIIVSTATDALYVPTTALITQNGTTYAKTLVGGKEVDVPVETGISSSTDTVILAGLTEGTTVITGTTTVGASKTTSGSATSVFSRSFGGAATGGTVIRTSGSAVGR